MGQVEASRRTGIPSGTIGAWAHHEGKGGDRVNQGASAVAAKAVTLEQRKQQLAQGLLDDIDRLRTQMFAKATVHSFDKDGGFNTGDLEEPTFSDKKAIATSVAIYVDKVQILMGQPTERVEHVDRTEAAQVADELAKRRVA